MYQILKEHEEIVSWRISSFFVVFAFLSFLLLENVGERLGKKEKVASREPDYYLESMVRTTTDMMGGLKNILRSQLVEHYPDDDSMELSKPHFEIYNEEAQPWHVVSESAWVSSGNEVVLLQGKVDIWKNDELGRKIYEIHTSEVRVLPGEKYAETDKPSKIIGPGSQTNSVGMRVAFAEGRVELMERVRSKYEKD